MATQFKSFQDAEAVLSEMTLEEKASLVTGASNYGTCAFPRFGIPALKLIDNGAGVNFRQYMQELLSRKLLKLDEKLTAVYPNGVPTPTQAAFIMDHVADRDALSDAEKSILDSFMAFIRENYVAEGEYPSCFPVASALASSWDPSVVKEVADCVGREASAYGLDVLLGTPCVNIQRDPLGGRNFECWSEDPYLTGEMAKEYALGVQEQGVLANLKHFAVNNQETRRRTVSAEVSERALREIYFPAFKKVIQEGGVKTLMTSYNKINGVSASENTWMLQDVLRKEWGFEETVMSDWGGVYHRGASTQAGNDLCMPHRPLESVLLQDLQDGKVTEEALDKACLNVLKMIAQSPSMSGEPRKRPDYRASEKAAYRAAAESIVLLKNRDKCLPLSEEAEVAFYGPLSRQFQDCGVGSGRVHTDKTGSLLDSARRIAGSDKILFEQVSSGTAAVVVTVMARGQEGADRSSLALDEASMKLIRRAHEAASSVGAKLILLLNVAGPVELTEIDPWLDAVLCLYFPGMKGTEATADALFGRINPSGKLAQTFPKFYRDCPSALNFPGEYDNVYYGEGIFVGYRYFDKKQIEPLYPFGFGLSYTDFAYGKAELSEDVWDLDKTDCIRISVPVSNIGSRDGAEVVELYVSDVRSTQPKPVRELKAFKKVFLKAGETKTVELVLNRESLESFDEVKGWVIEPGLFELQLGSSSRDIRSSVSVKVKGSNPYGYCADSAYLHIAADARAVDTINRILPKPILTKEELDRETNYTEITFTLRNAFTQYYLPKLDPMSDEEKETLLNRLSEALSRIDVTENENRYEEKNVD